MKKIKSWLAKQIYSLVYWIEDTNGYIKPYSYETAPYCGHHYSGHHGKYCSSGYHEGEGVKTACVQMGIIWIFASHHTDEGWSLFVMVIPTIYKFPIKRLVLKGFKITRTTKYCSNFLPYWVVHNMSYTKYRKTILQ